MMTRKFFMIWLMTTVLSLNTAMAGGNNGVEPSDYGNTVQVFKDVVDIEKNQAAGRDYERLMDFLQRNKGKEWYTCYSGAYIDDSNTLIVHFTTDKKNVQEIFQLIPFETEVRLLPGHGSYFTKIELLDSINKRLFQTYQNVKYGFAERQERALIDYLPCASFDARENEIIIRLAVDDKHAFRTGCDLFKDIIGDYDLSFIPCKAEDSVGSFTSINVQPGKGILVGNSVPYSLGFRANYSFDGETYYGFLTAAHNNSIGDSVSMAVNNSYTYYNIGTITRRWFGGMSDAAFIQLNDGTTCSQVVFHNTSTNGNVTQTAILNGTATLPAAGQNMYKSGGATKLTIGVVNSSSDSFTLNGTYFYGFISAYGTKQTGPMINAGDSGGVSFIITSGTTAKATGIASAVVSFTYYFARASAAAESVNVFMY